MEKSIDLRGLVCPEPVLRTKKLLDDASVTKIQALVDNEVNVNNLRRLANSLRTVFETQSQGDFYLVTLERSSAGTTTSASGQSTTEIARLQKTTSLNETMAGNAAGTVVFISKDKFGDGDAEFSTQLMDVFLQTLLQSGHYPRAILMANSGVKLMAPGSSALHVLTDFKQAGTEVLACGLCVDYYGLKDNIPKEQITNMFAICEFLMSADKVIQP